jgi:hypothetical protein
MFWSKKKSKVETIRKRNYPFTVKEIELLNLYRLNAPNILPYIESLAISEIQHFLAEQNSLPLTKIYYPGIMFAGRPMSIEIFLKLRTKFFESGFKFYKSDIIWTTSRLGEFHYFGYEKEILYDTKRECYLLIPNKAMYNFLDRITFECGNRSLLKSIIAKWENDYKIEIIWFDRDELLLYFTTTPTDIDKFYKEYFELVGCTFISEFSDEERKQKLINGFPSLYLNFKSQ